MSYKKYKAFSLFELVVAIFVGSIILVYSTIYAKQYYEALSTNEKLAYLKLDLNSAKIIVEKNLSSLQSELRYENSTLYFKNNTLLKKVTFFSMKTHLSNILEINIEVDNKIKQKWTFKL